MFRTNQERLLQSGEKDRNRMREIYKSKFCKKKFFYMSKTIAKVSAKPPKEDDQESVRKVLALDCVTLMMLVPH